MRDGRARGRGSGGGISAGSLLSEPFLQLPPQQEPGEREAEKRRRVCVSYTAASSVLPFFH